MEKYKSQYLGSTIDEAIAKALAMEEIFTAEEKEKVDAIEEVYTPAEKANVAKLNGKTFVNVLDESTNKIPTNKAVADALKNPTGLDNLAYVEGGTTATKAYVAGEYLVYEGKLYKTKTAIASGATFVVDTNIERTNVGEALENVAIYSDTAPVNGTTGAPKNGAIYAHVKGAANVDYYACIDAANKVWANIASIEPTVLSDVITASGTWTAPESVGQSFHVIAVGGGGGGNSTSAGSGASLQMANLTIPKGQTVGVTIGAGGTGGNNGYSTSFGAYLTAYGGYAAETNAGGSARSDDGMGGGGGGYGCAGGNGGYYGGGGGGGGKRSSGTAGNGGNGGYYGGGGGGAATTSTSAPIPQGGNGGHYGGNGGNGGNGNSSNPPTDGETGTNTVGMGLDFEGTGAGGKWDTSNYMSGGGGGGGYGGVGGDGGIYSSNNSGCGGGGGGYGGNGGKGSRGGSYLCGGGGGGYGGKGKDGDPSNYGGGGGGYGASNYGAGGNNGGGGGAGNAGVVIVQHIEPTMVWKGVTA